MVTPNKLLIASRGFVCKATVADSTWLVPPPEASIATTVRITLPALTVTVRVTGRVMVTVTVIVTV